MNLNTRRKVVVVWKVKRPPKQVKAGGGVGQLTPPTTTSTESRRLNSADGTAGPSKQFHPFADIFPMLGEDRLRDLAHDIKNRGLLDDIILYEGQILDGRCRYLACEIASVEPEFQDYIGDDPLSFVVSRNLHRRHLTESQRAVAAARLADLKPGANQHSQGLPIGSAAELLNIGARTVARAKEVLRCGVPELVRAVERGKISVSAAAKPCALPEAEQRELATAGKTQRAPGKGGRLKTKGDMVPAAEVEHLKAELAVANERQRGLEEELEAARAAASGAPRVGVGGAADDGEVPLFLDRRALSQSDQLVLDSVIAAWRDSAARAGLLAATPLVRERFLAALRGELAP
jgi:hypothetical protein